MIISWHKSSIKLIFKILSSPFTRCIATNVRCHKKGIVCGVLTGVVTDIMHMSDIFKFVLFADETNILYASRK